MKKLIVGTLLAFMTLTASAVTIGIAAGQAGSTTFKMISDVAGVCNDPQINVVTSEGSLDNIQRITSDKAVQMGYSQEDALIYEQGIDPRMMEHVQMVFPLFAAEIHVLVSNRSNVKTLADLAGKRVVESEEGTGTWVTAQVIKSTTGIRWQAYNLSKKDSLKALQAGTVDAAIFVEGRPIDLLVHTSGVHLLSLSNPSLDRFKYYTKTLIPSGTYPWQPASVPTYKVNVGLMTYSFKNQYQREIGAMVGCITRNLSNLQETGHPKWRDVDPTEIDRINWKVHPAAKAAIRRELRS